MNASTARSRPVEVSVVVPTYNEAENIPLLVPLIEAALDGLDHEIIIVDDDSPDGTWRVASELAESDDALKVLRRTEERGLSSAVLAGMRLAEGSVFVVLDADLQHDERIVPELVAAIRDGADVAVGSRAVEGGGYGEWSRNRRFVSWVATQMARVVTKSRVSDPMSGFFAISRSCYETHAERVNPRGFKILLEFVARGDNLNVVEVGYVFRTRTHGETKLTRGVALEYLLALIDLRAGRVVSPQFVLFALVGMSGMLLNLGGYLLGRAVGFSNLWAVVLGVQMSVIWNFLLNNRLTFRHYRYRGWRLLRGASFFQVMSSWGLLVQLSVFNTVREINFVGDLDGVGALLANAFAIAVAAVGNYFLHSNYTWRRLRSA